MNIDLSVTEKCCHCETRDPCNPRMAAFSKDCPFCFGSGQEPSTYGRDILDLVLLNLEHRLTIDVETEYSMAEPDTTRVKVTLKLDDRPITSDYCNLP